MNEKYYFRALAKLQQTGRTTMIYKGESMHPVIFKGSKITYEIASRYEVGDIVLCRVQGRFINAHQIRGKMRNEYLIGDNLKNDGWTGKIYAKAVKIESPSKKSK